MILQGPLRASGIVPNGPTGKFTYFVDTDGIWKKKDDSGVVTLMDDTTGSVTNHSDVSSAGSGAIITTSERNRLPTSDEKNAMTNAGTPPTAANPFITVLDLPSLTPTQHDKQTVQVGVINTSSTTYVNMPSVTLTAGNLGGSGTYTLMFSCYLEHSKKEQQVTFRFAINGTPLPDIYGGHNSKDDELFSVSINAIQTGISSGDVITVQWAVEGNTATTTNARLSIDGMLTSRTI